jgi:hypothetical protein
MTSIAARPAEERLYRILTGEPDDRVCLDIPESSCNEQPRNFLKHVASLVGSRTADGLLDARLVLAWLMGTLGAPQFMVGMLVPIREAGALLPQLVIAAAIRALPVRKWVWAAGSTVQGLSAIGMAAAALLLEGAAAGWAILLLLAVLALARSACSIAHKDVLGKTVSKSTRGTVSGTASSVSAVAILVFGALLGTGVLERSIGVIAAALSFASLAEEPGATEGGRNALTMAIAQFGLLREDPQLTRFTVVRCLLLAVPLAPPFLVALEGAASGAPGVELGPLVIASALANISSGYVWGRFADRSSRRVLVVSAWIGALSLAIAAAIGTGLGAWAGLTISSILVVPVLVFLLTIAEQGVKLGRTTHVVDMASAERRGAYTALSNTISGLLMLGAGVFGIIAQAFGSVAVLALFGASCLLGVGLASGLDEVQRT